MNTKEVLLKAYKNFVDELNDELVTLKSEVLQTSYLIEQCGASTELTNAVIQNGRVLDRINKMLDGEF